jgi:uncharacterized membrane protein YadS
VATAPVIKAEEEETAYAISTITIFGLLATIVYPYLIELVLSLNLGQAGIFIGTAVHDTSQVTGAAYIYDQVWNREASQIAITTKLVRNTFLMAVIPIVSVLYAKQLAASGEQDVAAQKINVLKFFPVFVIGFLVFAFLRSIGDLVVGSGSRFLFWSSPETWKSFYTGLKTIAKYLLLIAISGAGLSTLFSKLKKMTFKPFLIGLMAALSVGLISFILLKLLQNPISVFLPV